jgi:hypothetical protein
MGLLFCHVGGLMQNLPFFDVAIFCANSCHHPQHFFLLLIHFLACSRTKGSRQRGKVSLEFR